MLIRAARIADSRALSDLARQSKAQWNYSAQDLAAWAASLQVTAESIRDRPTFVSEIGNQLTGFYQLIANGSRCELDHLWVLPTFSHRGIGRQLLSHAIDTALQLGAAILHIDADPNAEAFYLRCGAVRVGTVSAPVEGQPARTRPQLVIDLRRVEGRRPANGA